VVLSPRKQPVNEVVSLSNNGLKPIMANSVMPTAQQESESQAKKAQKNLNNNGHLAEPEQVKTAQDIVENLNVQKNMDDDVLTTPVVEEKILENETATVSLPIHIVEKGESLFAISKRYNIVLKSLKRWNKLRHPFILKVGDVLYLADPKSSTQL